MKMDDRKFMILRTIIDDYISTAVPVGSRTISRKHGVGFSPATIRNEMSDLEELGYLAQPHTSAGRVPSAKAYRLYVDQLMRAYKLSDDDMRQINGHLKVRVGEVEDIIRSAAQALSDATNYTALVVAPHLDTLRIKRVQLIPITEGNALMIIVTSAGLVKDALVRVPEGGKERPSVQHLRNADRATLRLDAGGKCAGASPGCSGISRSTGGCSRRCWT